MLWDRFRASSLTQRPREAGMGPERRPKERSSFRSPAQRRLRSRKALCVCTPRFSLCACVFACTCPRVIMWFCMCERARVPACCVPVCACGKFTYFSTIRTSHCFCLPSHIIFLTDPFPSPSIVGTPMRLLHHS